MQHTLFKGNLLDTKYLQQELPPKKILQMDAAQPCSFETEYNVFEMTIILDTQVKRSIKQEDNHERERKPWTVKGE